MVFLEKEDVFIFILLFGIVLLKIFFKDFFTALVFLSNICRYKSIILERNLGKRRNEVWEGECKMGMVIRKYFRSF